MALSTKAQEVAIQLLENVRTRFKGVSPLAISAGLSYDTDGGAYFRVGSGVASFPGGVFKVNNYAWPLPLNAIGLPQEVYTPCTIKFCTEANLTGGGGADINTPAQLLMMIGEGLQFNSRFEWYVVANGTAPSVAGMIASNLQYAFDNIYLPLQLTT